MIYDTYHTPLRPLEGSGLRLKPLDLVVLGSIPEDYWYEEGAEHLKHYAGKYGIIKYYG